MTAIFPAIDLMGGRCVRLHKGDFDARTDYGDAPVEVAQDFEAQGATWLHVVDLDGAREEAAQQGNTISSIAEATSLRIQAGGGIRERDQIDRLLGLGVERVVLGSLCVTEPDTVNEWIQDLGSDRIVAALDVRIGTDGTPRPAVRGWVETSTTDLWTCLDKLEGLSTLLVTDIGRDGVLGGGNLDLYKSIQSRRPDLSLITSGGVGTLEDVRHLKALAPSGIIIGKALYEKRFTLAEAIAC